MIHHSQGPGLYVAALTLGNDGGALAILHRRCERTSRRSSTDRTDMPWREHFELRHVDRFSADKSRLEIVEHVRALLESTALEGETPIVLDVTDLGSSLAEHFYELPGNTYARQVHLSRGFDIDGARRTTPLADVCGALVYLIEDGRFKIAADIANKGDVARIEEQVRRPDDLSRIALAVALAAWFGKTTPTDGPWPGLRSPRPGTPEAYALESWRMDLQMQHDHENRMRARRSQDW